MTKCARTACNNEEQGFRHRDTNKLYCASCARRINEANNQQLISFVEKVPEPVPAPLTTNEAEFLKRYATPEVRARVGEWWSHSASRLYWALSYDADSGKLVRMSLDYIQTVPPGSPEYSSWGSSIDLARRTLEAAGGAEWVKHCMKVGIA